MRAFTHTAHIQRDLCRPVSCRDCLDQTPAGPRRRHPTGYARASLGRSCMIEELLPSSLLFVRLLPNPTNQRPARLSGCIAATRVPTLSSTLSSGRHHLASDLPRKPLKLAATLAACGLPVATPRFPRDEGVAGGGARAVAALLPCIAGSDC